MEFTAKQIADFLQGTVVGDPSIVVSDFSKIEEGKPGTLTFLANPKYTEYLYTTQASVVLVNNDIELTKDVSATLIKVKNSYSALAQLLELADSILNPKKKGVDKTAIISESAKIGDNVYIGPYVVISENVEIGDGCQIYPHSYISDNVKIGENVSLYAGVKIYKNCVLGNNIIIHAGTVIGSDGFGFAPDENGVYHKIPQLGNVVIEDDVEIGANVCVDRSSMGGHTTIKKGAKLDNLIQIAHNVIVGENTVMAAQTGIAGSSIIGKNCMFGGQSGIVGHLSVTDNCVFAARTGVTKTIKKPGFYEGHPHFEANQYRKSYVLFRNLPDLAAQINDLEKEIKELKSKLNIEK